MYEWIYLNSNNLFETSFVISFKCRIVGSGSNVLPGMPGSIRTEPFNGFLLFHLQRPNWYLAWATRIR